MISLYTRWTTNLLELHVQLTEKLVAWKNLLRLKAAFWDNQMWSTHISKAVALMGINRVFHGSHYKLTSSCMNKPQGNTQLAVHVHLDVVNGDRKVISLSAGILFLQESQAQSCFSGTMASIWRNLSRQQWYFLPSKYYLGKIKKKNSQASLMQQRQHKTTVMGRDVSLLPLSMQTCFSLF